jgi:3-oxoacyl-[acyl-carrier protein] reductase
VRKTALITGASRGIGNAIAKILSQNNIEIITPNRSEMDLSDPVSVEKYLSNINIKIDILVNNAGINPLSDVENIEFKTFEEVLQVNLISPVMILKHIVPKMKEQKFGRIVNISSIWSKLSKPERLMYSASKAGLDGVTRASAVELAKYNILVNSVAPGFVNTELTKKNNSPEDIAKLSELIPAGRLAEPDEIAEMVYFLCSDKNTYMTGQTIFLDGGFSCI